jgi:hypothetical protein
MSTAKKVGNSKAGALEKADEGGRACVLEKELIKLATTVTGLDYRLWESGKGA